MQAKDYLTKYFFKTEEKIHYSRHLPTYKYIELPDVDIIDTETGEILNCTKKPTQEQLDFCNLGRIVVTYKDGTIKSYLISKAYIPKHLPGRLGSIYDKAV